MGQHVPLIPAAINEETLQAKIYTLRGMQVMLDKDLAELYGVKPRRLREQVKRNLKRFPDDFMFQITPNELKIMVSQNATPSLLHLGGALPFVFTEQGVAGISGIIKSERAIEVHIAIMRTFVEMRRYLLEHGGMVQRLDTIEKRQIRHECKSEAQFETLFDAMENKNLGHTQGIFFEGQTFDAYVFINDVFRQAKKSIVLIDNYVDDSVLTQLSKRNDGVLATILTRCISKQLKQDVEKHNSQYQPIAIREFNHSHDRFLVLDDEIVYHIGASLKDLGKKWFAFSKMHKDALSILERIE
ncbi:MAG: ORF6N domain-containing protein [Phycisphaerales bacterium]|nr:ORF6N domain-containing protein [Phycisphaerales bacterium]